MPILLVKNPSAVRLRRNEKNSTPWLRLAILHDVLAISDQIEHLGLLLRRAVEIGFAVAVHTCGVKPHKTAAELQLVFRILAGKQINKLRSPRLHGAPGSASAGKIDSHNACNVLYCCGGKYFGVYTPALLAAFSVVIMWWAYSAACSGITRNTEVAAAPILRDFNTSRRDTDMLYLPFFRLIEQVL